MALTDEEREQLLEFTETGWRIINESLNAFSDEEMDREGAIGSWTPRDVMVHYANWKEATIRLLRDLDASREPRDSEVTRGDKYNRMRREVAAYDRNVEAWNEAQVARYHDVPLEEAKRYAEDTHAELLELVRTSPHIQPDWIARLQISHIDELLRFRRRLIIDASASSPAAPGNRGVEGPGGSNH